MARNTSFTFYANVNLNPRTNNTFYFADRSAQATFFNSKIITSVPNCYYQRADINKVRVQKPYSTLYKCDYLSFINPDYENKRFYAFVTGVTYIDDDTTELTYVVDTIQTWFLDCTVPPCFVERMHTIADDFGMNLLSDNLDCGEYVIDTISDNIVTRTMVVFLATFDFMHWVNSGFTDKTQAPKLTIKQGIYDNMSQVAVFSALNNNSSYAGQGSALQMILTNIYNGSGGVTIDDFINIYMYPSIGLLIDEQSSDTSVKTSIGTTGTAFDNVYLVGGGSGEVVNLPGKISQISGYTPKNKKCLQYPCSLLHITNNNGSAIDLKFERFTDPDHPQAFVMGTSCGENHLRLAPKSYLGTTANDFDTESGIDTGSYPTVSMVGDSYLIYLAQNRNKIDNGYDVMRNRATANVVSWEFGAMSKGATQGASSLPGSIQSGSQMASSFLNDISTLMAEMEDRAIAPNTAKGISGVGLAYQSGKRDFTICIKTVDREHIESIDSFYTMYGYPIRRVANITNYIHARPKFSYIKTVGCIVTGNVPETAKNEIEQLFDSGIRFWADYNNIGNFDVDNRPVI